MAKQICCPAEPGRKNSWPIPVRPQPYRTIANTNLVDRKGNKAMLTPRLEQLRNAIHAGGARNISSVTPGRPQSSQPLTFNKPEETFLNTQLPDLSQPDAELPIQIVRVIPPSLQK
jgi:hypothetical protein